MYPNRFPQHSSHNPPTLRASQPHIQHQQNIHNQQPGPVPPNPIQMVHNQQNRSLEGI